MWTASISKPDDCAPTTEHSDRIHGMVGRAHPTVCRDRTGADILEWSQTNNSQGHQKGCVNLTHINAMVVALSTVDNWQRMPAMEKADHNSL